MLLLPHTLYRCAAVHAKYLAGDVGGAVGSDLLYARVYLAPVTEIQLVEALGPHDAWGHGVNADVLRGKFLGRGLGERDDSTLGCRIGHLAGRTNHASNGRDVHEAAASAADHQARGRLDHVYHGQYVYGEHALHVGPDYHPEFLIGDYGRVVHHAVYAALGLID